ncbi:hypothetical protein ACU4GR_05690 [Methylobacterium oryzae CBMB20]
MDSWRGRLRSPVPDDHPGPGIWGVLIGAACVLAIVGSLCMLALDRVASAILVWRSRMRARRPSPSRSRVVHAGSRMTRKVSEPPAGRRGLDSPRHRCKVPAPRSRRLRPTGTVR